MLRHKLLLPWEYGKEMSSLADLKGVQERLEVGGGLRFPVGQCMGMGANLERLRRESACQPASQEEAPLDWLMALNQTPPHTNDRGLI